MAGNPLDSYWLGHSMGFPGLSASSCWSYLETYPRVFLQALLWGRKSHHFSYPASAFLAYLRRSNPASFL